MELQEALDLGGVQKRGKIFFNDYFLYESQLPNTEYYPEWGCIYNSVKGNIYFFERMTYNEHLGNLFKFAYVMNRKMIRDGNRWMVVEGEMPVYEKEEFHKLQSEVYESYREKLYKIYNGYLRDIIGYQEELKHIDIDEKTKLSHTNLIIRYTEKLYTASQFIKELNEADYKFYTSAESKESASMFLQLGMKVFDFINEECFASSLKHDGNTLFYINLSIEHLVDDYK